MCNRFRQVKTKENLSLIFDAEPLLDPAPADVRTDIYPRYRAWIIRKEAGRRVLDHLPWGIPLSMRGKQGQPLAPKPITNVRNLDSNFWRSTIAKPEWRCLVPFTSFAEPKPGKDDEGKPANWWFNLPASEVACFAGIWRPSEWGNVFSFLTCEPNPLVKPLHEKAMPVILDPADYDRWLDADTADACSLAVPFPSQLMAVA
ncbi:MAG TPA: SOS response-associated peptidase family protein [Allosphingosinicella sp.]|nr:SOS response-associated peptidase family protein [Allosphingosinicella sp.]